MTFTPEQVRLLEAKLNPAHIKPAQKFGPKGDYIEGWHAMAEANRIFGFGGWSYDVIDLRDVAEGPRKIGRDQKPGFGVSYIARVRVTAGGVVREDIGAGHGYDVDLGLAHESASKEAVTDALKRCLRSFGNVFGLALYDKTRENVGNDTPPPAPPAKAPLSTTEENRIAIGNKKAIAAYTEAFRFALGKCDFESEVLELWAEQSAERKKLGITPDSEAGMTLVGLRKDRIEEIGLSVANAEAGGMP